MDLKPQGEAPRCDFCDSYISVHGCEVGYFARCNHPKSSSRLKFRNLKQSEPMPSHTHRTNTPIGIIDIEDFNQALERAGLDCWKTTEGELYFIPFGWSGGTNVRKLWAQEYVAKPTPDVRAEFTTKDLGDAMQAAGIEAWMDSQGVLKIKHSGEVFELSDLLLAEAQHKVRGDREEEYGDKLKNFSRIGLLQSVMSGQNVSAELVALNMICVKLARLVKSPDHYDTLVDLIGYVLCYRDIRRSRNPEEYNMQEIRFRHELKQDKSPPLPLMTTKAHYGPDPKIKI